MWEELHWRLKRHRKIKRTSINLLTVFDKDYQISKTLRTQILQFSLGVQLSFKILRENFVFFLSNLALNQLQVFFITLCATHSEFLFDFLNVLQLGSVCFFAGLFCRNQTNSIFKSLISVQFVKDNIELSVRDFLVFEHMLHHLFNFVAFCNSERHNSLMFRNLALDFFACPNHCSWREDKNSSDTPKRNWGNKANSCLHWSKACSWEEYQPLFVY